MRSYYAHLETMKRKDSRKPIFRTSGIFPALFQKGIHTRVLFMGYWKLKRNISQITGLITLRSDKGDILTRKTLAPIEPKAYRIELEDLLNDAEIEHHRSFLGSIELEFFSSTDLVFPYPALVVNYYGPNCNVFVHTAERVYNDFEDMWKNSETEVAESGFNIYADEEKEPFITLINGGEVNPKSEILMTFYNKAGETLTHPYLLEELAPYATKILYPSQFVDLKNFLQGKVGAAKIQFSLKWVFPRLIVGNLIKSPPALSITHTYYDYTKATGPKDYWHPTEKQWHPASLLVPVCLEKGCSTHIYFYPIYSPSTFYVDIVFYDRGGTFLGAKKGMSTVASPGNKIHSLNLRDIISEMGIKRKTHLAAMIIARPKENELLPSRIKIGFDVGHTKELLPCNICTNLQPFNPDWEQKTSTFKWCPVFADMEQSLIWILNGSPKKEYEQEAKVELTFFREKDTETLTRTEVILPHGFIVVNPHSDEELSQFYKGAVGWVTFISTNPYTTSFYFVLHASGIVGGDHSF